MLFFTGRSVLARAFVEISKNVATKGGPRVNYCKATTALRPKKPKSTRKEAQYFSDAKRVRAVGGKGGDGCVSFLQLWCNERAGPDGGDGGNGGHVVFQASNDVRNFNHVGSVLRAEEGERGNAKDCHGKNAKHAVIKVPIGTIIRNAQGLIVGDLGHADLMFVAARGGAGGKGNRFFTTDKETSPKVCEYGPTGEDISYTIELRSMADVGLIGYPNAGKSTLLNALTRAKPKVAPYAFTTLRPHLGTVQYDDLVQITIADLPGLVPDAHLNKGLGIQFLKHAERCTLLLFVLDASAPEPWTHYEQLMHELRQFGGSLASRPQLVVANKIDMEDSAANFEELQRRLQNPVLGISAKMGQNLGQLLSSIRLGFDRHKAQERSTR
ncbi:GL25811 [Drosophila persimilis]|uniref:GL25811 n=1 Tax=Drosophila persimilis TaxID=7234 RepID=B4GJS9_DROPE|nr:mitochondrial ribosome-associated GTPase 2 [Drosophila persimilis]XP_026843452.1 mitochondrial ribosome-associated GTPase 2 [Drosophila persimilis]EDW36895.1 GL25811 [Drosophila persimilis]